MGKQIRGFTAVALAAVLGACFESAEPLIATNDADYPFDKGVRYTFYEWDKERRTWQPQETGTLRREGDHYVQLDDGAKRNDPSPILFKDIGRGYFIAQQKESSAYIYDLVLLQNDIAYQFGFACATEDKAFADKGLLDSFTPTERSGNTCRVSNFDKLKEIFFAIAAERQQPQGMYAIDRR
jgi:hypothetical protein